MRNWSFMAFSAAACIVLFACTTSSNNTVLPPAPGNPAPVVATNTVAASDAGDALGLGHHWDIQSVQAQRIGPPGTTYTEIVVSTTFELTGIVNGLADNAAFLALPAAGTCGAGCGALGGTALTGFILIDVDGNAATGVTDSNCGANGTYPGVDFFVDIGRLTPMLADGNPPVKTTVGIFGTQVGEATISGGGNVVNITIKIANIGGSSSGPFNVGVEWGNGLDTGTTSDCAPNAGYFADSVGRHPLSLRASAPASTGSGLNPFSTGWEFNR